MDPVRQDRYDERFALPCRDFMAGKCRGGRNCKFYHPAPPSMAMAIRVPGLPPSFLLNRSFEQCPIPGAGNFYSSSLAGFGHLRPVGRGSIVEGSMSAHGFGGARPNAPGSPSYSEYETAYVQIKEAKERELEMQNTLFRHIDWSEFLVPGKRPPPPIHVPCTSTSSEMSTTASMGSLIRSAGDVKILESSETGETEPKGFFTPREELKLKIMKIGKELDSDPVPNVKPCKLSL